MASVANNGAHEPKGAHGAAPAGCDPLLLMPGHRLSKLIKEGRLSVTRLCELYISRIKQVQPKINCMAEARFEQALREAAELDALVQRYRRGSPTSSPGGTETSDFSESQLAQLNSPLFGVPLSVKESVALAGMANSAGDRRRRHFRPERDAVAVANVRHFGLVPICTTNIPELTLYWADCQNLLYGRSRNPYNGARVTGASSGGEAGLIAAAGSLMGIGSDIGGSLRSPAHYCGIFAHKPSPFLISAEGNWPPVKESLRRLFTLGPMCRYATDLRHLLKLLLSDSDNPLQDSYKTHQPEDIGQQRRKLLGLLDEPHQVDFSQLKLFYCNFSKRNKLLALASSRESCVESEILQAQRAVLSHFETKFGCQLEQIDLEKYLAKIFDIWMAQLSCGGQPDRDQAFEKDEVLKVLGIESGIWELLRWTLGTARHTKEAILTAIVFKLTMPGSRRKAYAFCDKLEQLGRDIRAEVLDKLGENGVLVMPTLPTVAHRHHYSLLRFREARFTSLLNSLQMPATHATVGLSKKHKLPFGLTMSSRAFNDHLTIAMAEEIESAFGGWTLPSGLATQACTNETVDGERGERQEKKWRSHNKVDVGPEEVNNNGADGFVEKSTQTVSVEVS